MRLCKTMIKMFFHLCCFSLINTLWLGNFFFIANAGRSHFGAVISILASSVVDGDSSLYNTSLFNYKV